MTQSTEARKVSHSPWWGARGGRNYTTDIPTAETEGQDHDYTLALELDALRAIAYAAIKDGYYLTRFTTWPLKLRGTRVGGWGYKLPAPEIIKDGDRQ